MEPNTVQPKKSNTGIIVGSIIIIVIVAGIAYAFMQSKNSQVINPGGPMIPATDQTDAATSTDSGTDGSGSSTTSMYKDGTYTAIGHYVSPGGAQTVTVTTTLSDDVITDATVVSGAIDPTSQKYQNDFISGYKQYVIGKKIQDISLGAVSGSSLTPRGFQDALISIEAQAKA